jgi:hypothetical protein
MTHIQINPTRKYKIKGLRLKGLPGLIKLIELGLTYIILHSYINTIQTVKILIN